MERQTCSRNMVTRWNSFHTSIGLAIASRHTDGRHVCIVPDKLSRSEYEEATGEAGMSPEIIFGEAEEVMEGLLGIDFLVVDSRQMEIVFVMVAPLDEGIQNMAVSLKERIRTFESNSKTVDLANEIRRLSFERKANSFVILGLLEPWKADDETASILIFYLSNGSEVEEIAWPSQVLCSIMLPKMLVLEEPASRVLVIALVEYCKLHQRAAECGLLFPLIMKRSGINNHMCDVITRIVKECLHPAHVSAFCWKLLCGQEVEKRSIILPCHQSLVSGQLVWTESLFNLFQNILNLNVQLTQDSVDQLASLIRELAPSFSKSLKFGNFLLCFITRCSLLLKSHKPLLVEAVAKTNTLVTKSMLSKLASF